MTRLKKEPVLFPGDRQHQEEKESGDKTHASCEYNKWYTRTHTHKGNWRMESDPPWNVNCIQIYF